jgi:hypothetical protein
METLYPDILKKIWNELVQKGTFYDIVNMYGLLTKSQQAMVRSWMQEIKIDIFYKIMKECLIKFANDTDWDLFDDHERDYNFASLGYDWNYRFYFLLDARREFLNLISPDDLKNIPNGDLYANVYKSFSNAQIEKLSTEFVHIPILNPFDFYDIKKDEKLPKSMRTLAKQVEDYYKYRCMDYITSMRSFVIRKMNRDQFNEFFKFVQYRLIDLRHDEEHEEEIDAYIHCIAKKFKYLYIKFHIDFLHLLNRLDDIELDKEESLM